MVRWVTEQPGHGIWLSIGTRSQGDRPLHLAPQTALSETFGEAVLALAKRPAHWLRSRRLGLHVPTGWSSMRKEEGG